MAAYITVGAKTTHGGTVISGSPHTTHNGIPVARKGDKVACKKCKRVVSIATGDPSVIVDGSPIARAGDVTTCGSKLIANQQAFAESGFDVSGIEQAAALVFPKVEAEDLAMSLAGSTDDNEPSEIGPDGLPVLGSDSGKYANLQTEQFMNRHARNLNKNVINHGGSIHSGTLPAYQQEQNKKTAETLGAIASIVPIGKGIKLGKAAMLRKKLPSTRKALRKDLESQGFERRGSPNSGYETWKKPAQGNIGQITVNIKPTGEVIRTQNVWNKARTSKYPERQNYHGERLEDQSHSTGHFVK